MTISQEYDGNLEGNPKPIIEAKYENDDIMAKVDLEDEENEKYFVEELLAQLMTAMEEINNLKKENEKLKKIAPVGEFCPIYPLLMNIFLDCSLQNQVAHSRLPSLILHCTPWILYPSCYHQSLISRF